MSITTFIIVLFAAALHAGWNAVVKVSDDKIIATSLVTSAAAIFSVLALPLFFPPALRSWPFIGVSAFIHLGYFFLVASAYRAGDMGQTYPLMRGIAPLVVAFVASCFMGESLSRGGLMGIIVICSGVIGMALGSQREHIKAIGFSVVNAFVIASYTLIDGFGARYSGSVFAYALWVFLLTGMPLAVWLALSKREVISHWPRTKIWRPLLGGGATVLSYSLVLWAMTVSSIPLVAALRETAILFGAAISVVILKERAHPIRAAAAGVIAAGTMILRLA